MLRSALLSLLVTTMASAQEGVERRQFPLPGGEWRVVVQTQPPEGDYHSTRIEVRTDTVRRLLEETEGTAPAQSYTVRNRPDGFVLNYPCGNRYAPEGQTCIDTYRQRGGAWRRISRRTSSPWARAMRRYAEALRRGRIDRARAIVTHIGTSPNGGHSDGSDGLFEQLFAAVVRVAQRDARAGNIEVAAGRILDVLQNPPMTNVVGEEEGWMRFAIEGRSAFNQLQPTRANLAHVGHAEAILRRANMSNHAEQLRHQRGQHVDPREWEEVRRWFRLRERGTPPLPPTLMVDGRPATREEFLSFLNHDIGNGSSAFHLTEWAQPRAGGATHPPAGTRTITVAPDACPPQHECEGYAIAELFFDAEGTLVGINLSAAG